MANPIFPELMFVIALASSIFSRVAPTEIKIFKFLSFGKEKNLFILLEITSGSLNLPIPESPHA